MKASELGRRLRAAREAMGLSQQAVAEALGLPRTAVTQWEGGNRAVSTLELAKISRLYRRPVADFLQEDATDLGELASLCRGVPDWEEDPAAHEEIVRCINLCGEGVLLERLLGAKPRCGPLRYEMRMPRSSGEAVEQGEEIAIQERRRLGIGSMPVTNVPELIASQGIWATDAAMPNKASGMFLQAPRIGLAILVNASHPRGRKRLSYAHEYAHTLLDRGRSITVSSTVNAPKLPERRANAFAAAFLMPKTGVNDALQGFGKGVPSRQGHVVFEVASGGCFEAEIRSPAAARRITCGDVASLAHRFGVSYRAAIYRLQSLMHISNRQSQKLLEQEGLGCGYLKAIGVFSGIGGRGHPPRSGRELISEIAHLTIEALCREEISRGRALELSETLGIGGETLLRQAKAMREALSYPGDRKSGES